MDQLSELNVEASGLNEKPDTVKYETYQRVLSEKKKRDEALSEALKRLSDLESQNKQRQEEELKAKEDYKKLLSLREEELNNMKKNLSEFKMKETISKKAHAFLTAVGGLKKNEYLDLVDFDQIILTDEGSVDEVSLEKYKDQWVTKFPETLMDSKKPNMPQTAPKPAVSSAADEKQALLQRIVDSNLL